MSNSRRGRALREVSLTTFVKVNGMGALRRVGVTTVVKVKVPRGEGLQRWGEGLQRRWFDNNCQSQRGESPQREGVV